MSDCCAPKRRDWLLIVSGAVCVAAIGIHFSGILSGGPGAVFVHALVGLLGQMWWGLVLGIVAVGLLERLPREVVIAALGDKGGVGGIIRAMLAGLLLDLCNHGILLVAAQLYRRGATLGQTFAFLVASPWNSFTLTLILIGLIGLPWTLLFIAASGLIALIAGLAADFFVHRGILPSNPNRVALPDGFRLIPAVRDAFAGFRPTPAALVALLRDGWGAAQMIVRWILFGAVLAALIQTFVPTDLLRDWFGPTLVGLALTLGAATLIEVCSEGSTPIAADLFNRAAAPGNAFAFLMAGASTDYTEILVLRQATGRWLLAFALPILTLPQIIALGAALNAFTAKSG